MSKDNQIKFYHLEEFLDENTFPMPEPIIPNFLYENELVILSAKAKTGKSMLALDMALSISSGEPFLSQYDTNKRTVILFQTEISNPMLRMRLEQMQANSANDFLLIADRGIKIDHQDGYISLENTIKNHQPCLIILDPFYTMHSGDENQSSSMAPILFLLKKLTTQYQCSILLVHHQGKNGELSTGSQAGHKHRGSSSFADVPDMSISLTKQSEAKFTLTFECRNIETPNNLEIYRNDSLRHKVTGESKESREQWLLGLIQSHSGIIKKDLIAKSNKQFDISIRSSETIIGNLIKRNLVYRELNNNMATYFARSQDRRPL